MLLFDVNKTSSHPFGLFPSSGSFFLSPHLYDRKLQKLSMIIKMADFIIFMGYLTCLVCTEDSLLCGQQMWNMWCWRNTTAERINFCLETSQRTRIEFSTPTILPKIHSHLDWDINPTAYNSFKYTIHWLLVCSRGCATIIAINFRRFSSPQREIPHSLGTTLRPSSPPQP